MPNDPLLKTFCMFENSQCDYSLLLLQKIVRRAEIVRICRILVSDFLDDVGIYLLIGKFPATTFTKNFRDEYGYVYQCMHFVYAHYALV